MYQSPCWTGVFLLRSFYYFSPIICRCHKWHVFCVWSGIVINMWSVALGERREASWSTGLSASIVIHKVAWRFWIQPRASAFDDLKSLCQPRSQYVQVSNPGRQRKERDRLRLWYAVPKIQSASKSECFRLREPFTCTFGRVYDIAGAKSAKF